MCSFIAWVLTLAPTHIRANVLTHRTHISTNGKDMYSDPMLVTPRMMYEGKQKPKVAMSQYVRKIRKKKYIIQNVLSYSVLTYFLV